MSIYFPLHPLIKIKFWYIEHQIIQIITYVQPKIIQITSSDNHMAEKAI